MDSPLLNEGRTAVELVNVSKRFGASRALQGVSFRIYAGELVTLLGPNGAGKTTAIALMLGLRRPTSGFVRIAGRDPQDPAVRVATGALLQGTTLPTALRVVEVLNLFRSFHAAPVSGPAMLELIGLHEKAQQRVGSLSAGERQRLLFALALVGDPSILFLDEPTVFLDIEARVRFRCLARELVNRGRTIVLTTHHAEEAGALSDRVIVMSRGSVVATGTPAQIKELAGVEFLEDAIIALTKAAAHGALQ
jgi:ABC-2 type transport system ATP-binding protein